MRLPFTRGIGGTFPRGCDGHHILVVDCRVAGGTTPRIAPCRLRERRWRAQTENARTRWAGISESRRGWKFSVSGGTGAAVLPLPLRHAPFQPLTCVPTLRPALAGLFWSLCRLGFGLSARPVQVGRCRMARQRPMAARNTPQRCGGKPQRPKAENSIAEQHISLRKNRLAARMILAIGLLPPVWVSKLGPQWRED
jgi:hypothetical protein